MTEQNQHTFPPPSGFTCECGRFHEFGVYVAAHWHECLAHTCYICKAEHDVQRGIVTLTKPGKTKESETTSAK